jgi:hypothetical protein
MREVYSEKRPCRQCGGTATYRVIELEASSGAAPSAVEVRITVCPTCDTAVRKEVRRA